MPLFLHLHSSMHPSMGVQFSSSLSNVIVGHCLTTLLYKRIILLMILLYD